MEIPEKILSDIEAKSQIFDMNPENLKERLEETLRTHPAITDRTKPFKEEKDKITFAWRIVSNQLLMSGASKPYDVLVFGMSRIRKSNNGDYSFRIHGRIGTKNIVIIANRNVVNDYDNIKINHVYKDVRLSGNLEEKSVAFTVQETKFIDGSELSAEDTEMILRDSSTEFELINIMDNLSARTKNESNPERTYVVETDLKMVRGIIGRCTVKEVDDKITNVNYNITDESLELATIDDRSVISETTGEVFEMKNLLVLSSPGSGVYDDGWECYFVGNIDQFPDGRPFMNAISVIPC